METANVVSCYHMQYTHVDSQGTHFLEQIYGT